MREKTKLRGSEKIRNSSMDSETARSYAIPNSIDKIIFASSIALLVAGNIGGERLPIYGLGIAIAGISLCARCLYGDFRSLEGSQ